MLNVYFVDMPEAIYDTKIYFNNTCKDSWITKQLSREMIKAVDRSDVIDERTIHSPVFGNIDLKKLSGGVKTLMLIAYDKTKGNTAQLPNEQKYDIIDIWKDK